MASIPLAVAPSVRSPGLYLLVNMLAGAASPGTAPLRGVIIASKSAAGTITPDTDLRQAVGGADDVGVLLGPGVPGHLAAKAIFAEHPIALLDVIAPLEAAGVAATSTITFDDTTPVTSARTVTVNIAGRDVQIVWQPGELDTAAATKLVSAIAAQGTDLPVTGANGGGALAVVTLTAKLKGTWGNDVLVTLTVTDGAGGTVVSSGNLGTVVPGTTEPSLVNALTTIMGQEYDFILPCVGNTDADLASATSGPGRVKTHIDGLDTGANAKLQQAIVGVTGTISGVKTGTAQHNFGAMQYVFRQAGRSLGCEYGGAEMGARMREESIDPAVNRIRDPYRSVLFGPRDEVADSLTEAENEDLLQSGVTPVEAAGGGVDRPNRPITTYFKDGLGAPDGRILDVSRISGTYAIAKDLRISIPQQFPKKKLSPDLPPGDDELPEGVVEVRDIKAFVISRLSFWATRGVARRDKLDQSIADKTLIVRVNPSDPSQCDIVVPLTIVPPLAKFSLVVLHIAA